MSDPFIGTIRLVAFNFAPVGWALCQGQIVLIQQNPALFSLLGTYFGGDGVNNFGLPDLRGRTAVGQGQGLGLANYTQGQSGGAETVALTSGNAPTHTHTMMAAANVTTPDPGSSVVLGTPAAAVRLYGSGAATPLAANSIAPFGSSLPHENRQPYLALNYIIALNGVFPSRS